MIKTHYVHIAPIKFWSQFLSFPSLTMKSIYNQHEKKIASFSQFYLQQDVKYAGINQGEWNKKATFYRSFDNSYFNNDTRCDYFHFSFLCYFVNWWENCIEFGWNIEQDFLLICSLIDFRWGLVKVCQTIANLLLP